MLNSIDSYWRYIQDSRSEIDSEALSRIAATLESTSWDEPVSALDLNNVAVAALIEAENSQDLSIRELYLEMALEALNKGVDMYAHPLCAAHLALLAAMTGDMVQASQIAFPTLINTLQAAHVFSDKIAPGLVYLPPSLTSRFKSLQTEQISQILKVEDGYTQSLLVLSEALCRSQLAFYSQRGLRILNLATQLLPSSVSLNLKLGISNIINNKWEGILYLQRARQMAPNSASILQALYLAYRSIGQIEDAKFWLNIARELRSKNPESLECHWTELDADSPFTYVVFENEILLAVEPNFRSIVTSVLIAEGDWFEKEMEFWRTYLKPGMTTIDVGANVGVYTFSAARRVGREGRVIAVEPFSNCVRCLQETSKLNNFDWVKICAGAASDREGTAQLSLSTASEVNKIVANDVAAAMPQNLFESVPCFSLDSLIEQEKLSQVDFLKIDAEGHELSVLAGSERILSQFSPVIIYENIAESQKSNLPVAKHLRARGYELFRYQPYVQKLIPIGDEINFQGNLNIIAIPENKDLENLRY